MITSCVRSHHKLPLPFAANMQFKGFMQCAIENSDYYEPFLSMLLGEDTDEGKPGDGKADETHSAGSVAAPAPSNP